MSVNQTIRDVTDRITKRSEKTRRIYLDRMDAAAKQGVHRTALSCGNLAHGFAACGAGDKEKLSDEITPNIGIITAYNDMLSAHAPIRTIPIRSRLRQKKLAPWRRSPVAYLPCATGLLRAAGYGSFTVLA